MSIGMPPLSSVLQVNADKLIGLLDTIPDEVNLVMRLFDGKRSVADIIRAFRHGNAFDPAIL